MVYQRAFNNVNTAELRQYLKNMEVSKKIHKLINMMIKGSNDKVTTDEGLQDVEGC